MIPKRMPKKFLLDECVQICNKEIRNHYGFVNACEIVPPGTSDDILLENATKRKLTIITEDIRFTLNTLISGNKIVFHNPKTGIAILITPNIKIIENSHAIKSRSMLTCYLHETEEIVIP
jgi:hypothetical protein